MTRTVLFDLDGTLLPVEMASFLRHYITALSGKFAGKIMGDAFGKALIDATYQTIISADPKASNLDVFAEAFSRLTGLHWETTWQTIERYYDEEYHELRKLISGNTCACEVVNRCVDDGWQIVCATQPIYPERAVRERLAWCGVESMPWHFITTIDKMHYCKPNPEFYREIADLAGLDPVRCVMVGNNMDEDMVAKKVGMKTFLVDDFLIEHPNGMEPDARGKLRDVPEGISRLLPLEE